MAFSFEGLHEPLLAVIAANETAFRSGKVNVSGVEVPFDAEFIARKLASRGNEYATATIARVLEHLVQDPTNHIVLRFKTADNPDVIHIDSAVMEFIRKREFDVIMETGGFDAQFISDQLGLGRHYVAGALHRLAEDHKNFLGLINATSDNPAPRRDYGVSRDTEYAAAVAG